MKIDNNALLISCFVLVTLVLAAVIGLIVYELQYGGPTGDRGVVGEDGFPGEDVTTSNILVSSIVTDYFSLASGPIVFVQNNYTRMITANFVLNAQVVVPANQDIPLLILPFFNSNSDSELGVGKLFNTTSSNLLPGNLFFNKEAVTNVSLQTPSAWSPNDRIVVTFSLFF